MLIASVSVLSICSITYYCPILTLVLTSVAVIACVGLFLYASSLPVPAGLPQPWVLRANVVAAHIVGLTGRNFYDVMSYWPGKSRCRITNTHFDGVQVRVYEPPTDGDGHPPAVVYMHGGGFRCLSIDTLHPFAEDLATQVNAVVISIEYRLSTEAIYPAAIDDCTKATVWFMSHLEHYNVDSTRIAVMGESAGGNLAAGVTQRLTLDPQYAHLPKLRLQILMFPMLQALDFNTPSYQQYGDYETALLPKSVVVASWAEYLGDARLQNKMSANMHTSAAAKRSAKFQVLSHDLIPARFKTTEGYVAPISTDSGDEGLFNTMKATLLDPSFAPLMRDSVRGLPEAYVVTGTYDILRDDGILYVKKLETDGVKVTWVNYDDGVHCSAQFSADGPFVLRAGVRCRKNLFTFVNETLNS